VPPFPKSKLLGIYQILLNQTLCVNVLDHTGLTRNEPNELKRSFECHFTICGGDHNVAFLPATKVESKPEKLHVQFNFTFPLLSSRFLSAIRF
jgi:hypothetical protein